MKNDNENLTPQQQVNLLHRIFTGIVMKRGGQHVKIPGAFAVGFRPVMLAKMAELRRALDECEFEALACEYLDSQQN